MNRIINEKEKRRLDPKCWKGYHKAGTKKKGNVRVNKCIKNENNKFDSLVNQLLEMSVIKPSFLYKSVNKDENIIAAAIYDKLTGFVYTGDDHQDAYFRMIEEEQYDNLPAPEKHHSFKQTEEYKSRFIDGFYTDKDRFLDRNEALIFMRQHRQDVNKDDLKHGTELHSNVVQDYLKAS